MSKNFLIAKKLLKLAKMLLSFKEPEEVNYFFNYRIKNKKFDSIQQIKNFIEKQTGWVEQKKYKNKQNSIYYRYPIFRRIIIIQIFLKNKGNKYFIQSFDFV